MIWMTCHLQGRKAKTKCLLQCWPEQTHENRMGTDTKTITLYAIKRNLQDFCRSNRQLKEFWHTWVTTFATLRKVSRPYFVCMKTVMAQINSACTRACEACEKLATIITSTSIQKIHPFFSPSRNASSTLCVLSALWSFTTKSYLDTVLFTHCDLSLFRGLANLGISARHVYTTHMQLLSHQGAWGFRQMPASSRKVWAHLSSASQDQRNVSAWGTRKIPNGEAKKVQTGSNFRKSSPTSHLQMPDFLGFLRWSVLLLFLPDPWTNLSLRQKRGGSLPRLHSLVHIQSVYWLCQASQGEKFTCRSRGFNSSLPRVSILLPLKNTIAQCLGKMASNKAKSLIAQGSKEIRY